MSKSFVLSFLHEFFSTLHSIIYAKTPNKMWIRLLMILAILLTLVIMYNKNNPPTRQEGFDQKSTFVLHHDNDIYDKFYVDKYDRIMQPEHRMRFEINTIIEMTQPTYDSVFLDVGSGTGHLVNSLHHNGYRVFGIDKSEYMVKYCAAKYPDSEIVCKDASVDPMAFEHNTFSHIICTGGTIYEMADKESFFKNCYHWLIPNGYLIIHLVDRNKFDTIIPAARPKILPNPQKLVKNRITKSSIDFPTYSYESNYEFIPNNTKVVLTETFSNINGDIRQNENTLYMDNIDTILKIAMRRGFIVHAKVNMSKYNGDEHQFIYILERTM